MASMFTRSWPQSGFPILLDHSVVKCRSCHAIWREFMRKSCSGSRSVERWWKDIKGYLAVRNYTQSVDLWKLGQSAWHQELGKIYCVFWMMRWCPYTPQCSVHLCYAMISVRVPLCGSLWLHFPHISVCPPPVSPCETKWHRWEMDCLATMVSKCISKFSQSGSPGAPPSALVWSAARSTVWVYMERLR